MRGRHNEVLGKTALGRHDFSLAHQFDAYGSIGLADFFVDEVISYVKVSN